MVSQKQHCNVATWWTCQTLFLKNNAATLRRCNVPNVVFQKQRCDVATCQTWFSEHNTATLRRCDVPNVVFKKQRCDVATLRRAKRGFPNTTLQRCNVATCKACPTWSHDHVPAQTPMASPLSNSDRSGNCDNEYFIRKLGRGDISEWQSLAERAGGEI